VLIRLRGRAEDAVDGGRNRWPGVDLGLIDAVGGFQSIRIKPPLERDEAKGSQLPFDNGFERSLRTD
jgi:hypothetical protein